MRLRPSRYDAAGRRPPAAILGTPTVRTATVGTPTVGTPTVSTATVGTPTGGRASASPRPDDERRSR